MRPQIGRQGRIIPFDTLHCSRSLQEGAHTKHNLSPQQRIAHQKYETRQVRYRANCIKHTMIHKYLAREKYDNIPYIAQYTQLIPKSLKPPPGGSAHTAKPIYFVLTCVKICISWAEYKLPVTIECRLYGFFLALNMTSFSRHTYGCVLYPQSIIIFRFSWSSKVKSCSSLIWACLFWYLTKWALLSVSL